MKDKLVENSLQILTLFSEQNTQTGLGVNEICRRTGFVQNKQPITNSIKYLEKARLLETKRTKDHAQMRVKVPTILGNDILQLIKDMQELSDVCIKLRNKLHDTLSNTLAGEKKVVRSKLRDKGWTQEEINSYDHILKWGRSISSWAAPHEVIDILLIKYVLLLSKFILDYNNQRALTILNEIVMRIILEQFSILTDAGLIDELEYVYSNLTLEKWNTVVGATAKSRFLDYKFIKEEFRNAALAKLRILTPNKQIIDRELQELYNQEHEFSMKNEKSPLSAVIALCEEAYNQAKLDC